MKDEKKQRPGQSRKPSSRKRAQDDSWLDPAAFWNQDSEPHQAGEPEMDKSSEKSMPSEAQPTPESDLEALFEPAQESDLAIEPLDASKLAPSARPFRPIVTVRSGSKLLLRESVMQASSKARLHIFLGCFLLVLLGSILWMYFNMSQQKHREDSSSNFKDQNEDSREQPPKLKPTSSPVRDDHSPEKPEDSKPIHENSPLGTLSLDSRPSGAVVFINDTRRGVTPTLIKDVASGGKVTIRMELDGYRSWSHEFVFDAETLKREFVADLFKETPCEHGAGWVHIISEPLGATVELDGKLLPGKTPMVVDQVCSEVQHNLRVRALGYRTWWRSFILGKGKVQTFRAVLRR